MGKESSRKKLSPSWLSLLVPLFYQSYKAEHTIWFPEDDYLSSMPSSFRINLWNWLCLSVPTPCRCLDLVILWHDSFHFYQFSLNTLNLDKKKIIFECGWFLPMLYDALRQDEIPTNKEHWFIHHSIIYMLIFRGRVKSIDITMTCFLIILPPLSSFDQVIWYHHIK